MTNTFSYSYPRISGQPELSGVIKARPEDFIVVEALGFTPEMQGEHVFLFVEKKNLNTTQVAADLSRSFGVPRRDIGYSGMKDKQAVTRQWFSLPWPIKEPIPEINTGESWSVLEVSRHLRKLKRGVHESNYFKIVISGLDGDSSLLASRIEQVQQRGFPNYFGAQRFGHNGSNLEKALALFKGERKFKPAEKSILLSSARSFLFNQYLKKSIEENAWLDISVGDSLQFDRSNTIFTIESTEEAYSRISSGEVHPLGPLYGDSTNLSSINSDIDSALREEFPELFSGLVKHRLKSAFRPLRALPKSLNWTFNNNSCEIEFELGRGAFATALLRELIHFDGDI